MPKSDKDKPDFYLCGPMTSKSDFNLPTFKAAAENLRGMGYTVYNPGELFDGDATREFKEYMRPEIKALLETQKALVVLPGWQDGVGARLEVAIAAAIGLPVREFENDGGLGHVIYPDTAGRDAVAQMVGGRNPIDLFFAESDELPHEEAARIVLGPRGEFYDNPLDNFTRTALVWSGILYSKLKDDTILSAEDVALCMNGVKIAREAFRHRRDNIVDGHGYWMTLEMVLSERQRRIDEAQDQDNAK